jgi:putative glutamine amidotransferase
MGSADKNRRPLIAIPARFSTNASALRYEAEVTSRALVAAVYAAGGEPLVVHPHAPGAEVSEVEVAERLHWAEGILLPGGGDLSARWYARHAHHSLYDVDEEQDAFDLAVTRMALHRGIPLLSVCRGTQVVNVALGGTLVQDMDEHDGEMAHHRHHVHHVTVDHGTLAHGILGEGVEVSCHHHQCLDRVASRLLVTARSEEGVVEAVEMPGAPGWYLGVQWHPEDTYLDRPQQLAVFGALVAVARSGAG